MEKKRYYKKKGDEAHMGREWDSNEGSTDSSSDEDATNITVNKGFLFPNVGHKCLMAKDGKKKKVHSRDTPKYTISDDEGSSSDNEDDLTSLFANLTKDQKKKINELIESINEKDDLLECQEDLLVKENKKFVKLKNAYALEVEECEKLSKKPNICNDSISCLRDENASLIAKIEELNVCKPSTSTIEHVTICTRCRDVNVDAMNDQITMIKEQNDHIAKLNAKIADHELENEKFKFARSMLYNGRRPDIKDGIVF
jgi:chromosome segregation ATPase